MNWVHEQCPKIDSGTVLSQNWVKQTECTKCTACWPSQHTQVRTGARTPGRVVGAAAVSWSLPPAVSQALMAVSQRVWPCHGQAPRVLAQCRNSPARCIARHSSAGQPSKVTIHYCDRETKPQPSQLPPVMIH